MSNETKLLVIARFFVTCLISIRLPPRPAGKSSMLASTLGKSVTRILPLIRKEVALGRREVRAQTSLARNSRCFFALSRQSARHKCLIFSRLRQSGKRRPSRFPLRNTINANYLCSAITAFFPNNRTKRSEKRRFTDYGNPQAALS